MPKSDGHDRAKTCSANRFSNFCRSDRLVVFHIAIEIDSGAGDRSHCNDDVHFRVQRDGHSELSRRKSLPESYADGAQREPRGNRA